MGSLYEQIPFELGDSSDDAHSHLSGRAREINAAERQAVNSHPNIREPLDG